MWFANFRLSDCPIGLCTKNPKSHPRQWVDCSVPFYEQPRTPYCNPTHGSGWIFQIFLDKDLNNPPTTVGGIRSHDELWIESIRMNPPTFVGGI
jgi:hypothetical protein